MTREYADAQTVLALGVSPNTWARMHRWDRQYWRYFFMLKTHYDDEAMRQTRAKAEQDKKFRESLPAQAPRPKGRRR